MILEKVAVEEAVGGDSGGRGRLGVSGRGHGSVVNPLVRFQRALYCLFGGHTGHCETRPFVWGHSVQPPSDPLVYNQLLLNLEVLFGIQNQMPRVSPSKLTDLPTGAEYYSTRDEAIAQGGVLAEIVLSKTGETLYGVFPDQLTLCDSLGSFILETLKIKRLPATGLNGLKELYGTHRPFSQEKCGALNLPTNALWFDNEMGALTAFSLMPTVYDVATPCMAEACCLTPDKETPPAFYGVFGSPYAYAKFRENIHPSYTSPRFPFELNTLEYDKCRATLMGVKGALHKPPILKPISDADLAPFKAAHQIPQADLWFWTEEEALKAAGTTVAWKIRNTTLYAVYSSRLDSGIHVMDYLFGINLHPEIKAAAQAGDIRYWVVADPERYGTYPEGVQMPS